VREIFPPGLRPRQCTVYARLPQPGVGLAVTVTDHEAWRTGAIRVPSSWCAGSVRLWEQFSAVSGALVLLSPSRIHRGWRRGHHSSA